MKKRLIIILSAILLISLFFGCSAQEKTPQTTTETSVLSTSETSKTAIAVSTTKKRSAAEKTTAEKTSAEKTSAEKTTKKEKSSAKAETTKEKESARETHTQIDNLCTIKIECSSILNNMDNLSEGHESFVPENGIILPKTKCTFKKGESVFDILERICDKKGIRLTARETVYGIYVSGIKNIDEFDCGKSSGWVYTVNGKSPPKSCGKYEIENGDEIVFKFVCQEG